jgi:hypothetical protein
LGKIIDTVIGFFSEVDWPITPLAGQSALTTIFQGDNGQWVCYAQAREEQGRFAFYSICPLDAPEGKRQAVAEYLTRANYGLFLGNFEMNFEDGKVLFKTSIDAGEAPLSQNLLGQLILDNVVTMDRYLPGIMAVIYGGALPIEAIKQIEGETGVSS